MRNDECDLLCLDLPKAEAVRSVLPGLDHAQEAAARARAFADPTRLRLGAALAAGDELCVCDLAWVSGVAQNLVSHHVRQLRAAGLAASRRDGKLVMYRLTSAGKDLLALLTHSAVRDTAQDAAAPVAELTAPPAGDHVLLRGADHG